MTDAWRKQTSYNAVYDMNTHYSEKFQHAFVAGGRELKKLTRLLQDRVGKVNISAECADGFTREFETIEDLIAYENPKQKEICCIRLKTFSEDHSKSAEICMNDTAWNNILVDVTSCNDEEVVYRLKEEIHDVIAGMRPWYDLLHRVNLANGTFNVPWLLSTILFAFLFFRARILTWHPETESNEQTAQSLPWITSVYIVIINLVIIILYVGIVIGLNRLWNSLFPRAVFAVGQGESRFKHKERIQWVVIISFVVSLAAGLVIAIW